MGGGGSRRYDWETKVAAARDHVENGLTKTEVMAKYAIASIASLERWCRDYRSGGPEALRPKPKGRPKSARSRPKPEPTREQELAEQVAYLKAKVAYLEKLRALRAPKSRGASEAPSSDCWIGNGVLDRSLEDESPFGEFLRAPISEGGVEPLVVGPPHVVVEVAPQLLDRGVAGAVYELLLQQAAGGFDHRVVVRVALARQRSSDAEHVEQFVDFHVVELASPVRVEHLNVGQGEVERGERGHDQIGPAAHTGGMAGDAPVRQIDQQAHVRPARPRPSRTSGRWPGACAGRSLRTRGPAGSSASPRRPASCGA